MEEGFYRLEGLNLVGPVLNVINLNYSLTYGDNYPEIIDGWYIFNTKKDAYIFFGLNYVEYIQEEVNLLEDYVNELKDTSLSLTKDYVLVSEITQEEYNNLLKVYPDYKSNFYSYLFNDLFKYMGKLYRVEQPHTSEPTYKPNEIQALYTAIQPSGVIGPWVQPVGAQDSYKLGDKVTHNGFTWESVENNNVWEPGVFGWIIV